jgi:hypothetical protein
MNPGSTDLEHLISRFLDDEATLADRRLLRAQMRRDPAADALVEEYVTLDREVGRTLRQALGRSWASPVRRGPWAWIGRFVGTAAAACLVVAFWTSSHHQPTRPGRGQPDQAASASWFAPIGPGGPVSASQDGSPRPSVRPATPAQREWILIPGERPGEYMVIEVRRPRTRPTVTQGDY